MNYETDRSSRAMNSADFDTSADRVADDASYAKGGLATCTITPPGGLGIKDVNVLTAPPTDALTSYTDFQIETAAEKNWVLSLVAMVPCIQVGMRCEHKLVYLLISSRLIIRSQWI